MPTDDPGHRPERRLPDDPDLEVDEGATGTPLPVHLTGRYIALVAVGGAVGSAARHLASDSIGTRDRFPLGTFSVNLVGALLLGVLLEALARSGEDVGRRRAMRLLLGTGFMGGFTTYSALTVDTQTLLRADHVALAVTYALATVVLGLLATIAGIAVGRRLTR